MLLKTGLKNILLLILFLVVNNIVNNQEQYGHQNIVQACFQQHCYRLGVFSCVVEMERQREAPCEGTNSPRLFTPGETKALAKSKVHQ
jgi:hypothetical protein